MKAVWGGLEALDDRWFRRFQLAAEQSGCLGLLLRPAKYRGDPSWSEVQLAVRAGRERSREREEEAVELPRASEVFNEPPVEAAVEHERWLRVELVRCRRARYPRDGSSGGEHAVVNLKLEEHHGHLQVIEASRHETPALHLVSELADPAFGALCAPNLGDVRLCCLAEIRAEVRGSWPVREWPVNRASVIGMPLPEATVLLEHLHDRLSNQLPGSATVRRIRSSPVRIAVRRSIGPVGHLASLLRPSIGKPWNNW